MAIYRSVWLLTVYLLGVVGGVLACASLPITTLCGLTVLILGMSTAHYLGVGRYSIGGGVTLGTVAASAAASLAVIGLFPVVGGTVFGLTLLLAALSPAALRSYRLRAQLGTRCWSRPQVHSGAEDGSSWSRPAIGDSGHPDLAAALMTDHELCLAWRRSSLVLGRLLRTPQLDEQAATVATRQEYLDELERRDRAGFTRWLHAGARPASDPRRYLNAAAEEAPS